MSVFTDNDDTEMSAHLITSGKEMKDVFRSRRGRNVVVIRFPVEEGVTDTAPGEQGLVPRADEAAHDGLGGFTERLHWLSKT